MAEAITTAATTWCTPVAACRQLGISERTLRRRVAAGIYETRRERRRVYILVPVSDGSSAAAAPKPDTRAGARPPADTRRAGAEAGATPEDRLAALSRRLTLHEKVLRNLLGRLATVEGRRRSTRRRARGAARHVRRATARPAGRAAGPPAASAVVQPACPVAAGVDGRNQACPAAAPPPAEVVHWWERDMAMASQMIVRPGAPARGASPCACGGLWRYPLGAVAARPVWRCLHCGGLHMDSQRIAEV